MTPNQPMRRGARVLRLRSSVRGMPRTRRLRHSTGRTSSQIGVPSRPAAGAPNIEQMLRYELCTAPGSSCGDLRPRAIPLARSVRGCGAVPGILGGVAARPYRTNRGEVRKLERHDAWEAHVPGARVLRRGAQCAGGQGPGVCGALQPSAALMARSARDMRSGRECLKA